MEGYLRGCISRDAVSPLALRPCLLPTARTNEVDGAESKEERSRVRGRSMKRAMMLWNCCKDPSNRTETDLEVPHINRGKKQRGDGKGKAVEASILDLSAGKARAIERLAWPLTSDE